MLPIAAAIILLTLAAACILIDASRLDPAASRRVAALADAANMAAPPNSRALTRPRCAACEYTLPSEGPCPECGQPALSLPFPDVSADQLALALRTLAARHRAHAITFLLVIPATATLLLPSHPYNAFAAIPATLWILAAIFTHARPRHTRSLRQRTTLSFFVAMLGPLTLATLVVALPLFPPGNNLMSFPFPSRDWIYLCIILAQIVALVTAVQFQLTTVQVLSGLPHQRRLAARAALPLGLAFALLMPGLCLFGMLWAVVGPIAIILIPLNDRALARELLLWAESENPEQPAEGWRETMDAQKR